jgi:3-methyladenine DNA glycosylase AlkD
MDLNRPNSGNRSRREGSRFFAALKDDRGRNPTSGHRRNRETRSMTLAEARAALRAHASPETARVLQGFFKTAPGQYGAGDVFLGVKVPPVRALAKRCRDLPPADVLELLRSPYHEERLLALFVLVLRYAKGDGAVRQQVYDLYLANTRFVNNWDLVDVSAHLIVGPHLAGRQGGATLSRLARSASVWERRIAVIATFHFIRRGEHAHTLRLAKLLLGDRHDLMHKAVGWMLREVGKRDGAALRSFLDEHHTAMPRTMLRYAIERFPADERARYMARA